jgi:DNA-binding response OmpR family regulator
MTSNQIKLLIVDDDPIFRLGFCTALASVPGFRVIAQADSIPNTLQQLTQGFVPDILILELAVGRFGGKIYSLELCQQLVQKYSNVAIFILTSVTEPEPLVTAKTLGVKGYCPKGTNLETIVFALRRLASGGSYWPEESFPTPNLWQNFLARLGNSGKQQIQDNINQINSQLRANHLSTLDQLFWSGRKRELLVARWLVNRLTSNKYNYSSESVYLPKALPESQDNLVLPPPKLTLAKINRDSVAAQILRNIYSQIQLGTVNATGIILEIDILRTAKKQELLYIVLNQIIKYLEELSTKEILFEELEPTLWLIWQETTIDFWKKNIDDSLLITERELSEILTQEFALIQKSIFQDNPFILELFEYLLWEKPLIIDNISYRPEAPEAMIRAEYLLENLLIQMANSVMQFILNNFYDLEIFKYNLYHRNYRSSREIARFRNELSWRYRLEKYWNNPQNIFESRYLLLTLQQHTIQTRFIYAPRITELERLEGFPWLTTIILETRDAIAPRVRSIIAAVGSGLVYILTQVIGKGIGLIGKGILQGIGSTVQPPNYNKKDDFNPFGRDLGKTEARNDRNK